MHTSNSFKFTIGLGSPLLIASANAAAGSDAEASALFWLADLPSWVLPTVLTLTFIALSWVALRVFRRRRAAPAPAQARRERWFATAGGAVLGITVALLAAGPWQEWLLGQIAALPPTGAVRPSAGPVDLLESPDAAAGQSAPAKSQRIKGGHARHMKVNLNALDATTLNLNLFDDTAFIAVRDRVVDGMKDNDERRRGGKGGKVWVGHIQGYEGESLVILAAKGNALMGTVDLDGRSFEIVYKGGNTHAVRELDPDRMPKEFEPNEPPTFEPDDMHGAGDTADSGTTASTPDATAPDTTGQVIDLMVLYTPAALANAGSAEAMQAKTMNAITRANQAYINSQVAMQLNPVYIGLVSYTENGDMATTLSRLGGKTDGYMDVVHSLRNQYSADQVVLISTDGNYCGYAGTMTTNSTAAASSAFSVLHDDSVYNCLGNDSMAHELGHNQGNTHNVEDTSVAGVFAESYGYRLCGTFRDIMSYSCSGEPRIPYFSNPEVTYNGLATGLVNVANTADSMNQTAATVAAFRVPPTTAPTAPTGLTGAVTATNTVTVSWTDNDPAEIGYKLQRSPDGTNWTEIASLGEGTVSYVDANLTAGATYYYRVYAYNSIGNSAYSNTATVTVVAGDTTPPVPKISNPLPGTKITTATVSVKATATDNVKVSSLKIYINGTLKASTTAASLAYTWTVPAGAHTIRADARDSSNNLGTVSVSVTK